MNQSDYRSMLEELLELDEGLSSFEMEFIDSLSYWDGDFTENQVKTLKKIWNRHC